jgi:hypothetical protein
LTPFKFKKGQKLTAEAAVFVMVSIKNIQNDVLNHGFDRYVHVFVVIYRRNFTRDYLEAVSDSDHAVKTKDAPNFMNLPNNYKSWQLFLECTGALKFKKKL